MSVVSSVTLFCSAGEPDADTIVTELNAWLQAHGQPEPPRDVSNAYGGGKHPQQMVFGAGFNCLDVEAFAHLVLQQPWDLPENVVLVVQPEQGATRVWRPGDKE